MTIATIKCKQKKFLAASQFAVVGASRDQTRRGSKILSWYRDKHMNVIPIHPRERRLEGIETISSIMNLPSPEVTALSIATIPVITLSLLKQARALSIQYIWIQPGAYDYSVVQYIEDSGLSERVIWGDYCILRDGDEIIQNMLFTDMYE